MTVNQDTPPETRLLPFGFQDCEPFARQARLFETVARAGACLMSLRSQRRLFTEGIVLLGDTFGVEEAIIYLLDDKGRLTPQAGYGEVGRQMVQGGEAISPDDQSALGRAIHQQQAIYVAPPPESASPPRPELVLPLIRENCIGVLVLRSGHDPLREEDIPAFQLLADHLAIAIHHARLYSRDAQVLASVERRAKLLEAATMVGRDVTSIMDLDLLLAKIVDTICTVYGFYYAAIFLVDTKMKRWAVLRAGYGEAGQKMLEMGYLLEIADTSMIGWCIGHKQARIALDVGQDAVHFDNPFLPLTRSEMALPLIVGDEVIGALNVQSTQESAFDERDINTLQILADQLAIVINNAQLLNNLQETNRELVRTKTFEAIAQATGEAIHWVGNKAAPIPACVQRTREDVARLLYMADALLQQAPEPLRQHRFAQVIAGAVATLDEKLPDGRQWIAGLENRSLQEINRMLSMESILEDLDIIKLSAETILDIKENMIGPAREVHRRMLRIDELLQKVVTSMAIPSHVTVEQHYATDLPYVVADPRQLESVFNNLIKNAIEAMENRPEQRLTLEAAPAKTNGFIAVRVSDTGCGIPRSDLDRIWISFYTTKGDRGGTGLGLSSCLQIINQMEGKIEVESEIDIGTTFTVLLPALAE